MAIQQEIIKRRAEYQKLCNDVKFALSEPAQRIAQRKVDQAEDESLLPILIRYTPRMEGNGTKETLLCYYLVDYSAIAVRVCQGDKSGDNLIPGTLDLADASEIKPFSDDEVVTRISQRVTSIISADPNITWEELRKKIKEKLI